eukprot:g1229.t1
MARGERPFIRRALVLCVVAVGCLQQGFVLQALSRRHVGLVAGCLLLSTGAGDVKAATVTQADKDRLARGYKEMVYMMKNWDTENIQRALQSGQLSPNSCVASPLVVRKYLGQTSTKADLFNTKDLLVNLELAGNVDSKFEDENLGRLQSESAPQFSLRGRCIFSDVTLINGLGETNRPACKWTSKAAYCFWRRKECKVGLKPKGYELDLEPAEVDVFELEELPPPAFQRSRSQSSTRSSVPSASTGSPRNVDSAAEEPYVSSAVSFARSTHSSSSDNERKSKKNALASRSLAPPICQRHQDSWCVHSSSSLLLARSRMAVQKNDLLDRRHSFYRAALIRAWSKDDFQTC